MVLGRDPSLVKRSQQCRYAGWLLQRQEVRGPFQSVSLSIGQPREQRPVNGLADRVDSRAVFAQEKNCGLPHTSRLRFLEAPPLYGRLIGLKEGVRSLQGILAPRPQDSVEHPLVIGIDYPAHE